MNKKEIIEKFIERINEIPEEVECVSCNGKGYRRTVGCTSKDGTKCAPENIECSRCKGKGVVSVNPVVMLTYLEEDCSWLALDVLTDIAGDNDHSPYPAIMDCIEHMIMIEESENHE